jgi:hypothetical protein
MPLSHSSPNLVQPMPMMATWSRMPLLAMPTPLRSGPGGPLNGAGLPEVIVHALRRVDAPERHLDPASRWSAHRR